VSEWEGLRVADHVLACVSCRVWRAGIDEIPEGEELEYDPSAYVCYHSLRTEWPCLSFDIVRDNLGDSRHRVSLALPCLAVPCYAVLCHSLLCAACECAECTRVHVC
jgi:hypothetical protein